MYVYIYETNPMKFLHQISMMKTVLYIVWHQMHGFFFSNNN